MELSQPQGLADDSEPPFEGGGSVGIRARTAAALARFVEPSPEITDFGERRRIRLLSVLLLVMTPVALIGVLGRMASRGDLAFDLLAGAVVLGFAYRLSRTRHHAVAAMVGVFGLSFPTFVVAFTTALDNPYVLSHAIFWLTLPLFFASFVLDARHTALTSVGLLLGTATLFWIAPESSREGVMVSLSLLSVVAALSTGAAAIHGRDRRQVAAQLAERRRVEEALLEAKQGLEERVEQRTTELNAVNERLHQAQKMEAVGQLAGGVAHDFNNLLTVISGFTEVVVNDTAEGDPAREDLRAVLEAADRATALTRQLLAFGRRQVLRPQVLDVNEVLDRLGKMLRRLISEDVTLELRPSRNLGPVKVDPGQLEQVIINLVVNASDAMPRGGTLTISTTDVELEEGEVETAPDLGSGSFVMLVVRDTGGGMSEEVRDRAFEPFYTTKGIGHGTGLGLATVFGIVTQSGGAVEVDSEVDEGAEFRVYLPREDARREDLRHSQAPSCGGNETILVVEDEPAVRALTVRMLGHLGYRVLQAGNGRDALEAYDDNEEPVDLVLTDVVMPEMGGPECVEKLWRRRPQLPVVFMSGHADHALDRHGVLTPETRLVHKPFGIDELAGHVRAALDGEETPTGPAQGSAEERRLRSSWLP